MKKYIILVLIVLLISALFVGVLAAGPSKPAGESNTGLLYLYEKVPGPVLIPPVPWDLVLGGAWGKMEYKLSGPEFDFVFNGKGLDAGVEYTLIYYPDPWPGNGLICLGSATANGGGNVHIAGSVDTGDLPIFTDANSGAKIWLVLTDDVNCAGGWNAWNPTEYLFEDEQITFVKVVPAP